MTNVTSDSDILHYRILPSHATMFITAYNMNNNIIRRIFMAETIVKIENLVKRYHELVAVDHFNLTVSKGEILGLLGPNGSGKTTTMNCLLSLLAYDKGSIEVFGKPMKPDSYDLKRNIGVVFQNVAVFDTLTVQENIDYFCGLYIKDKKLRRQYVAEAVEFAGLSDFVKFYPKNSPADCSAV